MNLYEACYDWMKQRNVGFIDITLPFYVSAVCCHVMNLENKRREFYYEHGRPADLRLHIFLAAPPGYMKTFILQRLLSKNNSMFGNTKIKTAFIGSLTEAGFVGTFSNIDGQSVPQPGAAFDFMDHVLGIDEFSALTNMMETEHSKNLDNAMLTALDSGYLIKRLAAGELRYETHLTLLAGSQPARYNLTSGLGRRFCFIYFVPDKAQQDQMRKFRRMGKGVKGDEQTASAIYYLADKMVSDVQSVNNIIYHDSIYTQLDTMSIPHFEEPLYEKIALGYCMATKELMPNFVVEYNDTIGQLWKLQHEWRYKIKAGAQDAQVMQFIVETPGIEEKDLKVKMLDFGMSYQETSMALESLYRQRRIGMVINKDNPKQPKRFLWPYH